MVAVMSNYRRLWLKTSHLINEVHPSRPVKEHFCRYSLRGLLVSLGGDISEPREEGDLLEVV